MLQYEIGVCFIVDNNIMIMLTFIRLCVLLCILANHCLIVKADLRLEFSLSVTPQDQSASSNVTIHCSVTDKGQDSRSSTDVSITGFIIMNHPEDEFTPIAKICEVGQVSHRGHPEINGFINEHRPLDSYLYITWQQDSPEVYGHYKCVAIYEKQTSVRNVLSKKVHFKKGLTWEPIQVQEWNVESFLSLCTVDTSTKADDLIKTTASVATIFETQPDVSTNHMVTMTGAEAYNTSILDLNTTDQQPNEIISGKTLNAITNCSNSCRDEENSTQDIRVASAKPLLLTASTPQDPTASNNDAGSPIQGNPELARSQSNATEINASNDWQIAIESINSVVVEIKHQIQSDQLKIKETFSSLSSLCSVGEERLQKYIEQSFQKQQNSSSILINDMMSSLTELYENVQDKIKNVNSSVLANLHNLQSQNKTLLMHTREINDRNDKIENFIEEIRKSLEILNSSMINTTKLINQSVSLQIKNHEDQLLNITATIGRLNDRIVGSLENVVNESKALNDSILILAHKVSNIENIVKILEFKVSSQEKRIDEIEIRNDNKLNDIKVDLDAATISFNKSIDGIKEDLEITDRKLDQNSNSINETRHNFSMDSLKINAKLNDLNEKSLKFNDTLQRLNETDVNMTKSYRDCSENAYIEIKSLNSTINSHISAEKILEITVSSQEKRINEIENRYDNKLIDIKVDLDAATISFNISSDNEKNLKFKVISQEQKFIEIEIRYGKN